MAKQSIDPALLALQTAKKAMPTSLSTQSPMQSSLNVPKQQPQAISTNITPPVTKIGGISSPFGAQNINSSPVLGGATPQEIGTRAKELQSLPRAIPATGAEPIKKLSIDDFANKIKEKYPEYKDKDNKTLAEAMIKKYPEYKDKITMESGNFITDLGSGIGQSVTGFGNLGKKLAFGAVDLYRQSQGKEKLTPEQKANVEQTPMGQALNTITNWQTPEEKASIGGQIGMVAGSVAQGATLGTPLTSAIGKIPGAAQIATKAPILSKIASGIGQGLEGQLQYSATAEGKLPTSKELFTAGAFGGAVNAIGPIAKGIKQNIKLPSLKTTSIASKADDLANKMLTNMNRITKGEQEKFAVQQGKTVGQWLNDKGIVSGGEKTIDALAKGFKESIAKADEGLAAIKGTYKNPYLSTMAREAADFAENTLSPQANAIRNLANKADDIGLTMSETNDIKRFYERNNKFTYGKDITAGEKTVRATNLDNLVRDRQMTIADQNGLSNLREINKDTQGYRELLNKLIKNENGRLGNNAVTLTDWIVAGEVASNPSALALLVGKKIGSSNWFRTKAVNILNRLSSHTNEADKIVDLARIQKIQSEKDLNKFLSLPLKKNVDNLTTTALNSVDGNKGMVNTPGGIITPKPTPKTPPITVEKGAIGMGTPKVNNTPVIPPKATVAPSVSAPKVDTFKRMTELDSNPLYRKLTGGEILGGGKIKQGLFETPLGTITNEIMDGKVKKYIVNGKTYNASDLGGIREKQAPEVVAQANKTSKAISDLKAIESGKGNIMGSSLRSVLDDLGIKDVNSIPEGTESDILQMVRARKPVAPKKGMPKLGKEIMEQNITQGDDLISKAKKYKSADDMINGLEKDGKVLYHGTNANFSEFSLSRAGSTDAGFLGEGIYLTPRKGIAKQYGKNLMKTYPDIKNPLIIDDVYMFGGVNPDTIRQKLGLNLRTTAKDVRMELIKQGYDGVYVNELLGGGKKKLIEVVVLKPDKIKTESQLKQIREQANKKPLPPLPKLGKEIMEQNLPLSKNTFTDFNGKQVEIPKDAYGTLYHGTTKADAKSIYEKGFDTSKSIKGKDMEEPNAIFVSTRKGKGSDHSAGTYGDGTIINITPKQGVKYLLMDSKEGYELYGKYNTKIAKEAGYNDRFGPARQAGYDAIYEGQEIVILNKDKFDISKPLPPLPKKGK